jgi:transcriptional regulator with XRE-family HTH domain
MAELIEVSPAYYGKLERGINGPSIKRLKMIYEKLGIDITYLITGIANNELTIENMFNECPVEKRYDLGQLMKHAINIAKDTRK